MILGFCLSYGLLRIDNKLRIRKQSTLTGQMIIYLSGLFLGLIYKCRKNNRNRRAFVIYLSFLSMTYTYL